MAQLKGSRILLVEDNDMNQELALDLLGSAGMDVVLAVNGKEAVDKVQTQGPFDGVLMDCQMPVMDGYTATREIRQQERFQNLPIIAMTANAMAGDREKVLAAGMWDHIAKPLNVQAMFSTMARWIKPGATPPPQNPPPTDGPAVGDVDDINSIANNAHESSENDQFSLKSDAQQVPADPFAVLVNIDVKAGLATTMDNPRLYARLLHKFKDSQARFASQFEQALSEADTTAPARAAHTLNGTAGNIGAKRVQAAAAALEQACLTGEPPVQVQARLQDVLCALDPVMQSLRAFAGEAPLPAHAPSDAHTPANDPAVADLDRLAELLKDSDIEAMDLLDTVMAQAQGSTLRDGLRRVAKAVENFDFDAALLALQQARG
jgi:CheY-like chemotaxis protein